MKVFTTLILLSLLFVSCLPSQTPVAPKAQENSNASNNDEPSNQVPGNDLPETSNFMQLGTTKELSQLNLFSDYIDSFIIRGNEINFHLSSLVGTSNKKFCLVSKFPQNATSQSKEVLIMAARVRDYYNTEINAREYFLQVEVANESANSSDCLTVNLSSALTNQLGTSSFAYKLSDLCPNCLNTTTSDALQLYDSNGTLISDININHLRLGVMPPPGTSSGNDSACTTDSACVSLGFNCCLSGQCINHGEVKEGVVQSSNEYLGALAQILARPELIANYPEYFYICPNLVPTNPDNNPVDDNSDPVQQANNLFEELEDYYNCLNLVIDEFSICTKKEELVSTKVSPTGEFPFYAAGDDITFSAINPTVSYNNITSLTYAGIEIFKAQFINTDPEIALDSDNAVLGLRNDQLHPTQGQLVTFKMSPPVNPVNDTLKIRYRVDGTCEKLGENLARCKKFYKQGQQSPIPRSSDHGLSQIFLIPNYANTNSFSLIVEVGGVQVSPGSDTWSLVGSNQVVFSNDYQIYTNQEVVITYFVTSNVQYLMASRDEAQQKVDDHCACGEGITCNLKPVYSEVNGEQKVVNYACLYPSNEGTPPLQQTVFMSARTVAHRFYDSNGVHYDYDKIAGDLTQECAVDTAGNESNCNRFQYVNDDPSRPNNSDYTGFNEILGSFNLTEKSPVPATKVEVVRGRQYDIFTDSGVFSSCINCGQDYYSSLQKIFPDNFSSKGGGYTPNFVESRRELNQGLYNADDMKFGRACFVPPTMLPWSHVADDDIKTQRRKRLKTQHFLFANGYNKDWYGFDYGSLIGSFDGVKWFSIGNQRRIQATTNKLYLAINAYFGDVTANNTFKIVVSETAAVVNSGSTVTHDSDSDGAECQQAHFCSNDNDCITNLGYEYTCQNVAAQSTPWPIYDANGNEISGSTTLNLLSLVGGSNGQVKRCVYRGAGSVCKQNLQGLNPANSFTLSSSSALNGCSSNTYCANLAESKFNDRVSRYGITAANQNNKSYITDDTDLIGLGARILGRPFNYYGDKTPPSGVQAQLNSINVDGLCIPGKAPELAAMTFDLNHVSNAQNEADKILGIGRTFDSAVLQNPNYLAACPATNDEGYFTNLTNTFLTTDAHNPFAIAQNMSTNSLILPVFENLQLFNDEGTLVTQKGHHKNSCLRAPGASCFTDLDCSPNKNISGKIKLVTDFLDQINIAEQDFWKEELVCGNPNARYLDNSTIPNPIYDTTENKCCREMGKSFTYYSEAHEGSDFTATTPDGKPAIAGVNIDINDPKRYSRIHTTYDKQITEAARYPALTKAKETPTAMKNYTYEMLRQYNTLHLNNSRMCCTGAWVREHADGNHKFSGTSGQTYDPGIFKYLNWFSNKNDGPSFGCTGDDYNTPFCEMRYIAVGSDYEKKMLTWLAKFELLGIPQVLIETNDTNPADDNINSENDIFSEVTMLQEATTDQETVIPSTIYRNGGLTGKSDSSYNGTDYYSAANDVNFKMSPIFSKNKFNCCIPSGPAPDGTTNEQCCTGQYTKVGGPGRCCLPANTDVTVYTNRYVSSEGATINGQPISDNDIDPLSGSVKKEIVLQMASNLCCSGQAKYGEAISELPVYFDTDRVSTPPTLTRRFIESDTMDQPAYSIFHEYGRKWNNHVYCVDSSVSDGGGSDGGGGAVQN